MNVTNNITDEYDNITSSTYTNIINDYHNTSSLSNCTDSELKIGIFTPSLLLILPYTLSFLCLLSLMVYTLIKPLFNNK